MSVERNIDIVYLFLEAALKVSLFLDLISDLSGEYLPEHPNEMLLRKVLPILPFELNPLA